MCYILKKASIQSQLPQPYTVDAGQACYSDVWINEQFHSSLGGGFHHEFLPVPTIKSSPKSYMYFYDSYIFLES
jgi:hypothetical protein